MARKVRANFSCHCLLIALLFFSLLILPLFFRSLFILPFFFFFLFFFPLFFCFFFFFFSLCLFRSFFILPLFFSFPFVFPYTQNKKNDFPFPPRLMVYNSRVPVRIPSPRAKK